MSPSPPTDPEGGRLDAPTALVSQIATGDQAAFADLYDRLAPIVNGMLRRRGMGEQASATVLEDLFTRIWREAPRAHRSGASGPAWVLGLIDGTLRGLRLDRPVAE